MALFLLNKFDVTIYKIRVTLLLFFGEIHVPAPEVYEDENFFICDFAPLLNHYTYMSEV
jgi:hypothetical protein